MLGGSPLTKTSGKRGVSRKLNPARRSIQLGVNFVLLYFFATRCSKGSTSTRYVSASSLTAAISFPSFVSFTAHSKSLRRYDPHPSVIAKQRRTSRRPI